MRFKPRKIGERSDAARYVIEVVVIDVAGQERSSIHAWYARKWLAQMNGISLGQAQALLDQANRDYESAQAHRRGLGNPSTRSRSDREVKIVSVDSWMDDTVVDEEPKEREKKEGR